MILKSGITENSDGIEITKNFIRVRRVARNMQWGSAAVPPPDQPKWGGH